MTLLRFLVSVKPVVLHHFADRILGTDCGLGPPRHDEALFPQPLQPFPLPIRLRALEQTLKRFLVPKRLFLPRLGLSFDALPSALVGASIPQRTQLRARPPMMKDERLGRGLKAEPNNIRPQAGGQLSKSLLWRLKIVA